MRKIPTTLLLVLVHLEASFAQTKHSCITFKFFGECVALAECAFFSRLSDFVQESDVREFRDRVSACSSYGQRLICCERSTNTGNSATTLRPSQINYRPTVTTQRTTNKVYTTHQLTTSKTPTFQGDPLSHPNYRFFQSLKCGSLFVNRVAHGNNSDLFEFPWAAQLGYEKAGEVDVEYSCGATVISDFYVLTAAHCLVGLKGTTRLITVRLGEHDTRTVLDCDYSDPDDPECSEPVQDVRVKSFVGHPQYDRTNVVNDIGLVRLEQAANFKQRNIKPICLPFTPELQVLPQKFVVIGWGRTESNYKSPILQKASLPLYDKDACLLKFSQLQSKHKVTFVEGQFCAGGEGQVDACRGDSGSSVQAVGSVDGRPKMVQYGIVSYGITRCGVEFGFPGIYTKVSTYLNWILDNMQ